jgi:hypothetical protein
MEGKKKCSNMRKTTTEHMKRERLGDDRSEGSPFDLFSHRAPSIFLVICLLIRDVPNAEGLKEN